MHERVAHIKYKMPLYTRRKLRLLFLIAWEMLKKRCRCVCQSQNVCPTVLPLCNCHQGLQLPRQFAALCKYNHCFYFSLHSTNVLAVFTCPQQFATVKNFFKPYLKYWQGTTVMTVSNWLGSKLDGVGPVDNRPSSDKLHHFVREKKSIKRWHMTRDMWHVTHDTCHVTCYTWHIISDMWHMTCDR